MKKILFSAVALLFCVTASAQFVTGRNEITLSYGFAPSTSWIDAYGDMLLHEITGLQLEPTSWGAVTLGYNFCLNKRLSLGLQATYSTNKDKVVVENTPKVAILNSYWSVMPNLKYSWFRSAGIVTLYSRISAGALFAKSTVEELNESESEVHFAFQFSPIGVEVGRKLAGYAEAGVGISGSFIAGIRYRF